MMNWIHSMLVCLLIWSAAAVPAVSAEWKLVYRRGQPIAGRQEGWNGHIEQASWLDEDVLVYGTRGGTIQCVSTSKDRVVWSTTTASDLHDWSVCRKTRQLAFSESGQLTVIDCDQGVRRFSISRDRFAELLGREYAFPGRLAFSPADGSLFVCDYSRALGKHGYVLAPGFQKVTATFSVDAHPREMSFSPDGKRLAIIADQEVLCVRDWEAERDIFLQGTRVVKEPDVISGVIDAPFFSHVRHDGGTALICTRDGGWGTGEVQVHDIVTKEVKTFDAANGHIEMDVDFKRRRIVLTGTEQGLRLTDFDGKVLADAKDVTLQRNACVEFSPSGNRVVVGSWDNTVSVFELVE